MQIVIDIPYKDFEKLATFGQFNPLALARAVEKGIVLPKGHGRLIDADAIKYTHSIARSMDDGHNWNELCVTADEIADAPTVLEAESEDE